jgi:hypothetical protein
MEATLFSNWVYDLLKPFAVELQMGHPAMMKAIGADDRRSGALRLLPSCYVAPPEIRELRRQLRYRNLIVSQAPRAPRTA